MIKTNRKRLLRFSFLLAIVLCLTMTTTFAEGEAQTTPAATRIGEVVGGTINIRTGPSTGYSRITLVYTGKQVTIVGEESGWYHVQFDGVDGYIYGQYLKEITPAPQPAEPTAEQPVPETGTVVGGTINIRTGPGTNYNRITLVYTGRQVTIVGEENGWYHVQFDGVDGYIYGQYLQKNVPVVPSADSSAFGANVVAFAQQYLGVPYVYGGSSPSGFDCSGFTRYVYALAGVSLPHSATDQFYQHGSPVEKADLQVGDAVFFFRPGTSAIGHVGIYIGGGNFIHARTSIARVSIDSLNSTYYRTYYAGAKRMK